MSFNIDKITIDKKEYLIIDSFPVLWEDWEMDNIGYVVKLENGDHKLVMSSHGEFYFCPTVDIKEKIEEYEKAIKASKRALNYVGGNYD